MHPKVLNRNKTSFEIEKVHFDLKNGTVEIYDQELAQNVSLAFSVALLYVLCQPRVQDEDGKTVNEPKQIGSKAVRRLDSDALGLVVAAGYLEATPCNSYIKTHLLSGGCAGCLHWC